jgi:hypothetical protein
VIAQFWNLLRRYQKRIAQNSNIMNAKKPFFALAVAVSCILIGPKTQAICFSNFEKDYEKSKVIFIGKLRKSFIDQYWIGKTAVSIYTFSIQKSFKGLEAKDRLISILSPIGYQYGDGFTIDSTYLVFGYGNTFTYPFFYTNGCTNTSSVYSNKAQYCIPELGKPIIHEGISDYDLELQNYYSKSGTNDSLSKQIEFLSQQSITQISSMYKLKVTLKILIVALGLLVAGCFYYFYRRSKT